MVITDFDGIVTDNCVYINEDYTMSRKLNFKDITGFYLLKHNGYEVAIISGEKNSAIELLSKKLEITEIHQNIRNKIEVLREIIERYKLQPEEFVYLGDDINDIDCLKYSKYKITVPEAISKVKEIEGIQITRNSGGSGAFREVVDCLIG